VLLALGNGTRVRRRRRRRVGVRYQRSERRQPIIGRPPRPGARRSRHLAAVSRTSRLLALLARGWLSGSGLKYSKMEEKYATSRRGSVRLDRGIRIFSKLTKSMKS